MLSSFSSETSDIESAFAVFSTEASTSLARFMTTHEKEVMTPHKFAGDFKYGVLFPGLMIAGVGGLVALEKHISALAIIGMLGISLMFLGGTRIKWLASLAGVLAFAACMLIIFFPYAFARVDTWLNIEEADPLGSAWQTLQGLMAIGSGGIFGLGYGNSLLKYCKLRKKQAVDNKMAKFCLHCIF